MGLLPGNPTCLKSPDMYAAVAPILGIGVLFEMRIHWALLAPRTQIYLMTPTRLYYGFKGGSVRVH